MIYHLQTTIKNEKLQVKIWQLKSNGMSKKRERINMNKLTVIKNMKFILCIMENIVEKKTYPVCETQIT